MGALVMDRSTYIGGSDVAGILGISPWRTPLDVYLDKTKGREAVTAEKEKIFRRGARMEPYVIDLLAEEEGLNIVARGNRYIDPELNFLAAEIDAEAEGNLNIEIKTVSPFKAKEWGEQQTDEIPVHYTAQVMHGLMVTGRDECILGVLIGGDDFRVYRVQRDDETIAAIRQKEIEFWDRIRTLTPPDAISVDDVLRIFATDSGRSIECSAEVLEAFNRLRDIKAQIKILEAEAYGDNKKGLLGVEEQIKLFMQDATTLTVQGQPIATWKAQSTSRFDQTAFKAAHPELFEQFKKTTESRVLRLR